MFTNPFITIQRLGWLATYSSNMSPFAIRLFSVSSRRGGAYPRLPVESSQHQHTFGIPSTGICQRIITHAQQAQKRETLVYLGIPYAFNARKAWRNSTTFQDLQRLGYKVDDIAYYPRLECYACRVRWSYSDNE